MISFDGGQNWKVILNGDILLHNKSSDKFSPIFTDENLNGILFANSTE